MKYTLCVQSADEHMPLASATCFTFSQNQGKLNWDIKSMSKKNAGWITSSRFPKSTDTLKVGFIDIPSSFLAIKKDIYILSISWDRKMPHWLEISNLIILQKITCRPGLQNRPHGSYLRSNNLKSVLQIEKIYNHIHIDADICMNRSESSYLQENDHHNCIWLYLFCSPAMQNTRN